MLTFSLRDRDFQGSFNFAGDMTFVVSALDGNISKLDYQSLLIFIEIPMSCWEMELEKWKQW